MNLTVENRKHRAIRVPPVVLERSGLSDAELFSVFALENSVVVLKDTMNAKEVLAAFKSMTGMAQELLVVLALACGQCEESSGACGEDDAQDGLHPIQNLAPETREILLSCGVCLDALDELLLTGETIYGGP